MSHPDLAHDPEAGVRAPCPCGACGQSDTNGAAAGWHERKGPLPVLRVRHGRPAGHGWRPRWMDHPYRLRLSDDRWRYVAEPYELDEDALADLAYLADSGFDVSVTTWKARHYPGHTVAVAIETAVSDA